jgi:SP family sugar:H+ symporter-like MFS transporter
MLSSKVNNRFLIVVCSIAASCQFATGFELGRANSYYYDYSNTNTTLYITSLLLGLSLGAISVKFLTNYFGRRSLMIISAAVLLLGTSIVRATQNIVDGIYTTVIGRTIDGVACGIGSTVAPIYSEA